MMNAFFLMVVSLAFGAPSASASGGKLNVKAASAFHRNVNEAIATFQKHQVQPISTKEQNGKSSSNGHLRRHLAGMDEDETCEDDLVSCLDALSSCGDGDGSDPSYLYTQMANSCTLHKLDGSYELRTDDMDDETYQFSDRPFRIEETYTTMEFFESFDDIFASSPPNAVFTFVHSETDEFEGPLVAVQVDAMYTSATEDDDSKVTYTYVLEQSDSQADVVALEDFFEDGSDMITFEDCSIFIDSSSSCNPTAGYVYCASQGCVRPWEPNVNAECCNSIDGYAYLLGCAPTSTEGCCKSHTEPPTLSPTPTCVADGGYEYCADQGCVQPWDPSVTMECCNQLAGYEYLVGCAPTSTQGCCSSPGS
ncbi:expressed unknown protein [Seminavis robusta]|uniref:Uncharacterized protein n=1 Tax=Seminavis robusta TaxID=568900 RepID=A0A9N8DMJ6_9STRA|nr:expressed unknown protein [Seminavis robusta]|eukprot:Sro166_g074210.1 n/a (365) ;mRNA; f:62092-63186